MSYYGNYSKKPDLFLTCYWLLDDGKISTLELSSVQSLYQAQFTFYSDKPPFMIEIQYYSTTYEASNLYCQKDEMNWISNRSCCQKEKQCWCSLIDQLIWDPSSQAETRISFKDKHYYQLRVKLELATKEFWDKKDNETFTEWIEEQKAKKDIKDQERQKKIEETKAVVEEDAKAVDDESSSSSSGLSSSSSTPSVKKNKRWKFIFTVDILSSTPSYSSTHKYEAPTPNYNSGMYGTNAYDYTKAYNSNNTENITHDDDITNFWLNNY